MITDNYIISLHVTYNTKFAFIATFYIKYFTCQPLSIGMFSKVWRNEKLKMVFLVDIYDYNDLVSCSSGTCLEQG